MNDIAPHPDAAGTGREPQGEVTGRWVTAIKIAGGLAALALLVWFGRSLGAYVPRFAEWVEGMGIWGPVVFIAGYAAATVAFIPGLILTMAAGAIFGLLYGTLYVFIASTTGATSAFLIARYGARRWVQRKLEDKPRFRRIDRAVGREGLKVTFLLRLSPVFPFNLLNYALGLTGVRLRHYLLACFGMLPGTFLYVYLGAAIGSLAAIAAGERGEAGPAKWALLGVGLIATIAVTTIVTRIARRALTHEVEEAADE